MSIMIKIAVPLIATILLSACGGSGTKNAKKSTDDTDSTPATSTPTITTPPETTPPKTTTPPVIPPPTTAPPVTPPPKTAPPVVPPKTSSTSHKVKNQSEASKFLNRATFGPTVKSINNLVGKKTYENWLNEQYNAKPTLHTPKVKELGKKMCANENDDGEKNIDSWEYVFPRHQIWWETAMDSKDQLRQRVAFALSEILVISNSEGLGLSEFELAVTSYYDILVKHAFGNYRDILEDVTLHPAMGDFLSMTRNQKENIAEGIRPDENYARELLQLFAIGVHELNIDGTDKLDANNQPIPTYNQKTIEEFAKVFTGWTYSGVDWNEYYGNADHTKPLVAIEKYHDKKQKTLLNGAISPASQTAKTDLKFALDNIFKHDNVAPFISKQLIKRLITSNPSPAYVARVATIFNDNGKGVKGDLKAVVNAIMLDDEALAAKKPNTFGKLREPLLRMSHLWRAFSMQKSLKKGHYWQSDRTCGQGSYPFFIFWDSITNFGEQTAQNPLGAKSVFNFFRPDYSPNGALNDKGLAAPEFQIMNENTLTSNTNLLHYMVMFFSDTKALKPKLDDHSLLNLSKEAELAKDTDKLLNHLSLILLNNEMSASLRAILKEHLNLKDIYPEEKDEALLAKAQEAILLIISSPEYLIQR